MATVATCPKILFYFKDPGAVSSLPVLPIISFSNLVLKIISVNVQSVIMWRYSVILLLCVNSFLLLSLTWYILYHVYYYIFSHLSNVKNKKCYNIVFKWQYISIIHCQWMMTEGCKSRQIIYNLVLQSVLAWYGQEVAPFFFK